MRRRRVLLVDDDDSLRWVTQTQLTQAGYDVAAAADGASGLLSMAQDSPDLVITDLKMPGMSGLDLLRTIRRDYSEIPVILVTAFGTVENAVEAMKSGAYDYVTKPVNIDELRLTIERALEHLGLKEEVRLLRASLDDKYGFENILGSSNALLYVLDMASRAARAESTVLIRGETGTGKELLAKAIHFNSRRKNGPFATINCGAIPKDLLESELFGHVKGAFTGATANKKGKVEMADGGTLFLDEIGELPIELQVKLLRLLQQGEIEKLGVAGPATVDVRIIAATYRNLQAMVEDGAFREDLYYRLAVIPLDLPPLRDRTGDIPVLVQHFFLKARERLGRPELKLPAPLIPYFSSYTWPGNIRELENIIERIVVLSRGDEIALDDLPEFLRRERIAPESFHLDLPPQGLSLEAVERDLIVRALDKFNGNQTRAAQYLDLSRKTLIYRMEKYGLRRESGIPAGPEEL